MSSHPCLISLTTLSLWPERVFRLNTRGGASVLLLRLSQGKAESGKLQFKKLHFVPLPAGNEEVTSPLNMKEEEEELDPRIQVRYASIDAVTNLLVWNWKE